MCQLMIVFVANDAFRSQFHSWIIFFDNNLCNRGSAEVGVKFGQSGEKELVLIFGVKADVSDMLRSAIENAGAFAHITTLSLAQRR